VITTPQHAPRRQRIEAAARCRKSIHFRTLTLGSEGGFLCGDRWETRRWFDDQAAMYRSMLAVRRALIVLDNARSAEQVRPLLPGAGTCLVLVTSRNRLDGLIARDGATRIALGVLTADEATALVASISDAGKPTAEPCVFAELARLCGYLPLALRIAAERAATPAGGSLADLAAELSTEDERLDLLAVADDVTSVRKVFASSYHALPEAIAQAFGLLGLHPGTDISTAAAGALLGTTPRHARTMLDELARGHLIEQTAPDRYRFHDLIRVYAAELAAAQPHDQQAEATSRLVEWYLHTADTADAIVDPRRPRVPLGPPSHPMQPMGFGSYAQALRWCEAESGNLPAITRHAADCGLLSEAWQLPSALFGYFYLRKPWTAWISTAQTGLTAARRAGDLLGQPSATQASASPTASCGNLRRQSTISLRPSPSSALSAAALARPSCCSPSAQRFVTRRTTTTALPVSARLTPCWRKAATAGGRPSLCSSSARRASPCANTGKPSPT
jgi:hypothetical protein